MAEISPHSGTIKDGKHILPLRVYYEDTDVGGVVYYANYLKYMERGRSDMLRLLGVDQSALMSEIRFVVRRCEIDYRAPAHLDDILQVHTRITRIGGASLMMEQDIKKDGQILNRGVIKVGVLDGQGNVARLPQEIKNKLRS